MTEVRPVSGEFELGSAAFHDDPYAWYRRLRERDPVSRTSGGELLLTGYRDCVHVLGDAGWGPPGGAGCLPDPIARRVRREMAVAARTLAPTVARLTGELLDAAVEASEVDVLSGFGYPLASAVACEAVGVPLADRTLFTGWADAILRAMGGDVPPAAAARRDRAVGEFDEYLRGLLRQRRERPGDDLISALATDTPLAEPNLVAACRTLVMAGYESTANMIGNGVYALLCHPDQLDLFQASTDEVTSSAVEELLRYDTPLPLNHRSPHAVAVLGRHLVHPSERVAVGLGAANRDPAVFADPDVLDLTRSDNRHLAFGHGPHFCPGAALARMELKVAFGSLVRRAPGLALVRAPEYRSSIQVRGLESLRVTMR